MRSRSIWQKCGFWPKLSDVNKSITFHADSNWQHIVGSGFRTSTDRLTTFSNQHQPDPKSMSGIVGLIPPLAAWLPSGPSSVQRATTDDARPTTHDRRQCTVIFDNHCTTEYVQSPMCGHLLRLAWPGLAITSCIKEHVVCANVISAWPNSPNRWSRLYKQGERQQSSPIKLSSKLYAFIAQKNSDLFHYIIMAFVHHNDRCCICHGQERWQMNTYYCWPW